MNQKTLLLSALALTSLSAVEAAKKPNVIFVLADDMGYGDVSFLDQNQKLKTPHLDKMAREGVYFTDAHSSSSVSTPTRYGIMTGRHNWRSSLKKGVLYGYSPALIETDRNTMADMFKSSGYTTAMMGKWHLGWDWVLKEGTPEGEIAGYDNKTKTDNVDYTKQVGRGVSTYGFDYSRAFCGSLDMQPYVWVENDMPTMVPTKITVRKAKNKNGAWWREGPTSEDFEHEQVLPELFERAGKYIQEKAAGDEPFFLYLPIPAPHTPILPIGEYVGKSGLGTYGDFVLMVDGMMGKLFAALEQAGCDKNTLVVFTTDNGCSTAANISGLIEQGHYPNSIFRGHKADLFDGGHRIPCIVRYPDGFKHHAVDQTICTTDFYATFAAMTGYRIADNEAEDSFNILPALKSKKEIAPIREATIHHSIAGQFTIRKGDWKLLLSPSSGGWSHPRPNNAKALEGLPLVQLYNMKDDISETTNVQDQYPEVVAELRALLIKYIKDGRSTPGQRQENTGGYPWEELKSWL